MTAAEVAALIMADSDESDMENGQNDDRDSDRPFIFDESTANQAVHQDSESDETDYHPSESDPETGPTEADNQEDEAASDIKPESNVRNTYKAKDPKVKWSKGSQKELGRLPKKHIIQNKNIGPTTLVPQYLNIPLQVSELVFKREFIEPFTKFAI